MASAAQDILLIVCPMVAVQASPHPVCLQAFKFHLLDSMGLADNIHLSSEMSFFSFNNIVIIILKHKSMLNICECQH